MTRLVWFILAQRGLCIYWVCCISDLSLPGALSRGCCSWNGLGVVLSAAIRSWYWRSAWDWSAGLTSLYCEIIKNIVKFAASYNDQWCHISCNPSPNFIKMHVFFVHGDLAPHCLLVCFINLLFIFFSELTTIKVRPDTLHFCKCLPSFMLT